MELIAFYMFSVCAVFLAGLYIGKKWGIPFIKREREYSIGIYEGKSPLDLTSTAHVVNPVLRARDVTDVPADFIADPFMVKEKERWYMFFEVMNANAKKGDIGLAISDDGFHWRYERIVITESFHLSYPYVFKWEGAYYMVPESCEAYAVKLYKAVEFPGKWEVVKNLLTGNYFDSSLFHYAGRWWLFTSDRDDVLHLFYADDLLGSWKEHPKSPVVLGNAHIARPGGRVVLFNNKVVRYTQDCEPMYGYQVRAFEITELTLERYEEREVPGNPVLKPTGSGWNAERMHHIDAHEIEPHSWRACVDAIGGSRKFTIKRPL